MTVQMKSGETLIKRLLPTKNHDAKDRALAWWEWYVKVGEASLMAFIRVKNDTVEPDMDIFQEAITTAFVEVERGNYQPCVGIPLTAYVKGIARNKIREARRRSYRSVKIEDALQHIIEPVAPSMEKIIEGRERWNTLEQGLSQLSCGRRQVLEAYLNGQSTAEIAQDLGMSEALVRQHKSRGLRSLKAMVAFVI